MTWLLSHKSFSLIGSLVIREEPDDTSFLFVGVSLRVRRLESGITSFLHLWCSRVRSDDMKFDLFLLLCPAFAFLVYSCAEENFLEDEVQNYKRF